MIWIGIIIGLLVGIPCGMIYEDLADILKIKDKKREDDRSI